MSQGEPLNRLQPGQAGRALVVDDDPVCRRFCADVLSAHGWRTHQARTADEALRRLGAALPDLVLLDCRLPDPEARQRLIRQCAAASRDRPMILAMSADPPGTDAANPSREPVPGHFLRKPFAAGDLLAAVGTAITGHRTSGSVTPRGDNPFPKREPDAPAPAPYENPSAVFVERFRRELPDDLDRLDQALATRDWLLARHTLHRLRGAAAISGQGAIAEDCRRLHLCLKQAGPTPGWGALYTALLEDGAVVRAAASPVRRRE
ncbi:Hpt domain-containing protein [Elongatibacter sediminis]|uniref:Hpt domain-containing protein n=1 Tax=Elongatibacter sediminis TaxID=3119006 RepID=A0AAW9R5B0_9GAMM